jgi:hypothetical protein
MREVHKLSIYVLPECPGCERARWTAHQVREHCPETKVDLIDLSELESAPPGVFSAPTYVLDGQVISLGNPRLADLLRCVETSIGGGDGHDN